MRGDLTVIGMQGSYPVRVAASATRFEVGEPIISTATLSSGAASANTFALAAADCVVLGTNFLGGIALKAARPFQTGTLVAQTVNVSRPIPHIGRIEGKAETSGNVDTAAELLAIIQDATLIDYDATGGTDGGELYTIKDTASADTSAFQIVEGNTAKGTLQVVVDARAYRIDNDIS